METTNLLWGLGMVAGGVFVGIYGEMLFQFVLAMIGFLVGFTALYLLLDGQSQGVQILFALIAGGIGAFALYTLVRIGIYVAGAALGAVVGILIAGLIGLATDDMGWLTVVLLLIGAVGVGFFGPRLGAMIVPLGTSAVAAFMMTYGYLVLFESTFNADATEPEHAYSRKALLVLFAMFYALSFLGQWNISNLRRRLLNR